MQHAPIAPCTMHLAACTWAAWHLPAQIWLHVTAPANPVIMTVITIRIMRYPNRRCKRSEVPTRLAGCRSLQSDGMRIRRCCHRTGTRKRQRQSAPLAIHSAISNNKTFMGGEGIIRVRYCTVGRCGLKPVAKVAQPNIAQRKVGCFVKRNTRLPLVSKSLTTVREKENSGFFLQGIAGAKGHKVKNRMLGLVLGGTSLLVPLAMHQHSRP